VIEFALAAADDAELLEAVGRQSPRTRVLLVADEADSDAVRSLLASGAAGYFAKDAAEVAVAAAIVTVAAGEAALSGAMLADLVGMARERPVGEPAAIGYSHPAIGERFYASTVTVDAPLESFPALPGEMGSELAAAAAPGIHPVETVTMGEAAQTLGVSVSTLRRWADAGEIDMVRTAGGHRRFPLAEVRRLAQRSARLRATAIRTVEPPAGPLPALADLLRDDAATIAEAAARATYAGQADPGWFGFDEGLAASSTLLEALQAAAATGDYEAAVHVSLSVLRDAQLAGASVLERHVFLERVSELVVRILGSRAAGRGEVAATGRLLLSVRQAHLRDVA
jgi:excisionase family DNA binding protein